MLFDQSGSIRLFRVFGVEVRLHWLWFLVAGFMIWFRVPEYTNKLWAVAEYLSLFAIVLMHEFGHALACKSVGGRAERIILWPLGGVAFVQPPMRPWPFLWSIAAGPLVNVVLLPITIAAVMLWGIATGRAPDAALAGLAHGQFPSDMARYLVMVTFINGALLGFNLLPIYPLDGGQILQALLWFFLGFARSLRVVAIIGLAVAVPGGMYMLIRQDPWMVLMAFFIGSRAWYGYRMAGTILRAQRAQARAEIDLRAPAPGAPNPPTIYPRPVEPKHQGPSESWPRPSS
jgi:Zn-dependent protease